MLHRLPLTDGELRRLQRRWRQPQAILQRRTEEWRQLGIGDEAITAFQQWRQQPDAHSATVQAEHDHQWLRDHGGWLLWPGHALWPPLLKEISSPPALLYGRGQPADLSASQLAIVGSRRASRQGVHLAAQITSDLVTAGFVITSGLAYGIDAAAHQAALAAGGATVAVLGTGIDVIYPRRHRELFQAIVSRGTVVSELRLGTPPRPDHFPRRNRLISGLSAGVLVVEAALRSGSLITARLALEQNREVFAVPGSPASLQAQGCNALLRDGAALVESAADILAALGHWWHPPRPRSAPALPVLAEPLASVHEVLAESLMAPEQLAGLCGQDSAVVAAALVELELLGLAEQQAGAYRRVVPTS